MKNKLVLIALIALAGVPLMGYSADTASTGNQQIVNTEKKPLYWVDPMEPTVHYKAPGKSRMGMDLEPVYAKEKNTQ